MVEGHGKQSITKAHSHWSKGGAIALHWKCKLWTGIAQALFNSQPCNLRPHIRLLMPNNFVTLTFDLWPLDLPPFWIIWKPVKILLLLGFSSKVHRNFYTWTLDIDHQIMVMKMILILKMQFLWTNENVRFHAYYTLASNCHILSYICMKLKSMVEQHAKYHWNQSYSNWSKGGAVAWHIT